MTAAYLTIPLLLLALFSDGLRQINEFLQATQGDLQYKRAIVLSEETLSRMTRVDIAATVDADTLRRVAPELRQAINNSSAAKANDIVIHDLSFSFDQQRLSVLLEFTKALEGRDVTILSQASAFVGASTNALHWNLYLDGFQVKKITGNRFISNAAITGISLAVLALRKPFNAILDEAINDDPEKAILLSLNQPGLIDLELEDLSDETVSFKNRTLKAGMVSDGAVVIVKPEGLLFGSQISFAREENAQKQITFPADQDLIRYGDREMEQRLARYQHNVKNLLDASMPGESAKLWSLESTRASVSRQKIAGLIAFLLDNTPIQGSARFNEAFPYKSDISIEIKRRDCDRYMDQCKYKNICEGHRCEETVTKKVRTACDVGCCILTGGLGCLIKGLCKEPCDKLVPIVQPIQSLACSGFRESRRILGDGLCNLASNVDVAFCQAEGVVREGLCNAEQELARFYESNPIATVSGEVRPNASLDFGISNLTFSNAMDNVAFNLETGGSGSIYASIGYDRHNYALPLPPTVSLGLACVVDWKESVNLNVTDVRLNDRVEFNVSWENDNDNDNVPIKFRLAEPEMLYVDFKPSPLVALFVGKPQVTLNCPLMAATGVLFGAGEAILSQDDVKQFAPLLTGEDLPYELKDLDFSLDIKPLKTCLTGSSQDACDRNLVLRPEVSEKTVTFALELEEA